MSNLSEYIGNFTTPKLRDGEYEPKFDDYYYRVAESVNFYGLSLIIPFGLIGNFFSICVLLLSGILRRTTSGQYLIALALADSTVLIGDGIRWLSSRRYSTAEYYFPQYLGLNVYDKSDGMCAFTNFLRYGGCLWSVWITVAIAAERLFSVAFPHKVDQLWTMVRARIAIVGIFVVSFGLGSFPFWTLRAMKRLTSGVVMSRCVVFKQGAYDAWNNSVVKVGTLLLPGVIITVLTVVIIVLLCRSSRSQRNVQSAAASEREQREETSAKRKPSTSEIQMTIMLLAVCIATVALRAPYTISYYVRSRIWMADFVDPTTHIQTYMAYRITDMVNTINYAINFVLYCVWGRAFRREAKRIFCRAKEAVSHEEDDDNDLQLTTDDNVRLNEIQNKPADKDV